MSSPVIATFDRLGIGCVTWQSGEPRLSVTKSGGILSREDGSVEKKWQWLTHDKPTGPEPFSFSINGTMLLVLKSRSDITITLKALQISIPVGKPEARSKTWVDCGAQGLGLQQPAVRALLRRR